MKFKNFMTAAHLLTLAASAVAALTAGNLRAASVTYYDSILSLGTNGTKNYTFTDPASSQAVTIALTMTAYDPASAAATFSVLDGNTRLSVDGNLMDGGIGVNFSASLVSAGSGVATSTIQFGIGEIGIRPVDGGGDLTWASPVSMLDVPFTNTTEVVQSLDATVTSLNGATYAAQLRFPTSDAYQLSDVPAPGQSLVLNASFTATNLNAGLDPQTNSWFIMYAGKYARITTNDATRLAGTSVTTWNNGVAAETQTLPAYCGVQEIYSSANWIYIRTTGLGSHTMGPWYNDATRIPLFINWPVNQKTLYHIPRTATAATNIPAVKTSTAGGDAAVGYFVDGVAMFDPSDGFSYSNGSEASPGTGQWHRDAYIMN